MLRDGPIAHPISCAAIVLVERALECKKPGQVFSCPGSGNAYVYHQRGLITARRIESGGFQKIKPTSIQRRVSFSPRFTHRVKPVLSALLSFAPLEPALSLVILTPEGGLTLIM